MNFSDRIDSTMAGPLISAKLVGMSDVKPAHDTANLYDYLQSLNGWKREFVTELPDTNDASEGVLYMKEVSTDEGNTYYEQFIWDNDKKQYMFLSDTKIDLSGVLRDNMIYDSKDVAPEGGVYVENNKLFANATAGESDSKHVTISQEEYDNLDEKDPDTVYFIEDDFEHKDLIDDNTTSATTTFSSVKITDLISVMSKLKMKIVTERPSVVDANADTIYLIEDGGSYRQWICIDNTWQSLGLTQIDLSGYTKQWYGTQEEYDAISVKDSNVDYNIYEQ